MGHSEPGRNRWRPLVHVTQSVPVYSIRVAEYVPVYYYSHSEHGAGTAQLPVPLLCKD